MLKLVLQFTVILLGARSASGQLFDVVRDTTSGKVKGQGNLLVEKYLGIPYASPPVGELRWKPPRPHPGWENTREALDATKFRPYCLQNWPNTDTVLGDEDCLFLNIYVPRTPSFDYLPVMVWIYGGGFLFGYSDAYDSTILSSSNDVIVVTFNYRVGALGFLNTGDNQSRGNYGLLDQLAALQWVQENIQSFGGDKNRVTIFGESAGAASVLMQAITPLGLQQPQLFHRVISQSGSPFSWWAYNDYPEYHALKLMKDLNCPTFSISLGLECLRKQDARNITAVGGFFSTWNAMGVDSPFVPSKDGNFLTDIPDAMVMSEELRAKMNGRYQFLTGVNNFDTDANPDGMHSIENEKDFKNFITSYLKRYYRDPEKITDAIIYNYVDWKTYPPSERDWKLLAINATRDIMFLAPSQNFSNIAASIDGFNSTVYTYFFTQRPGDALIAFGAAFPREDPELYEGARHAEEIAYVFGLPFVIPTATSTDRNLSSTIMTYWTNFAKNGDPNIGSPVPEEWPKYDALTQEYMVFGTNNSDTNLTQVRDHLESDKVVFLTEELGMYEEGKGLDDSVPYPDEIVNDTLSESSGPPIVETKGGLVQGLRIVKEDYMFDRFMRIPYAKPPVGMLRFMPPEPHPGWNGILKADGDSWLPEWLNGCATFTLARNGTWGKEDCLFLNVWVPGGINTTRDRPLPVMVWLYGGAYEIGRSTGFGFYYTLEKLSNHGKVIGVSLNYRLAALGFMSTLDENAPGNAGFLDQVAALQWIQDNIANFGGDPGKVTIFGESAGAGSVSYHMISPLSKNLVHRGISESGATPAHWTLSRDPLYWTHKLANSLGCPTENNKILVTCLKNKPVNEVVTAAFARNALNHGGYIYIPWTGVIDGHFIPEDPVNMLNASMDKDYLLGHNSMDGHMFASVDFPRINIENFPMSRDDVSQAATMITPNIPVHAAEAIAFKYIDWEKSVTDTVWPKLAIVDMYTDSMFTSSTYWTANERSLANGTGRTYMYRFSQKPNFPLYPEWMEANHVSEVEYVLGHPFINISLFDDDDRKLSLAMMTHWTNFAWSGNPNYPNQGDIYATWPEYTQENKYAFELNTSIATDMENYPHLLSNYRGEFVELWSGLLKDIWLLPLDTCPVENSKLSSPIKTKITSTETQTKATCVDEPLVRSTESGCIRGYEHESNGKIIERYLGIPYAKPPTGTLRFRAPQPAQPWTDILNVTSYSKICPQFSTLDDTMSEDCLYMCVYVPQVNVTSDTLDGLPVMVWIHGGGYMFGNGMEKLKGDTLGALGDVIVVNFNYRLGSFGFLTTDDQFSPGNYGLLDQQFALNWVKNNIANFGGNSDKITIFGNSAGGQSVLYQTLTPTNLNLGIKQAIVESATIIPRGDMKQRDNAISLVEATLCDVSNDNEAMVDCLRNLDAAALLEAQASTGLGFSPTVDGAFLPTHPRNLVNEEEIRNWKYIIGVNSGEGSLWWRDIRTVADEEGYHNIIRGVLSIEYGWRTNLIDQQYADYDDLSFFDDEQKIQLHLTELFGDESYIAAALKTAGDYTDIGADVFLYYFTYPHDRPDFGGYPAWAGAAHSAEYSFVFGDVINDDTQPEEVKDLSLRIIQYWSNFAKTGDPSSGYSTESVPGLEWPTFKGVVPLNTARNYIQLDIGNKTQILKDLKPTENAFWNEHMVAEAQYCETAPVITTTPSTPVVEPEYPEIYLSNGLVRGKKISSGLFDADVFLGIPYAKPPVANLRFAPATEASDWTGTLDAIHPRPPCVQMIPNREIIGTEDCLYLDVFMPSGLVNKNLSSMPVIIWIHGDTVGLGGSFWSGGGSPVWESTSSAPDPSYLASFGNAVVIRPNFRLGVLGFLTTEGETFGGNYALSDLQQVLLWATKNVGRFGGDLNKLTLIGQGSGAVTAELLAILPETRSHVKRVISQSSSVFSPWVFCSNNHCKNVARNVFMHTNCQNEEEAETLTCLRELDVNDIIRAVPFKSVSSDANVESNAWGTWRFTKKTISGNVDLESLFANSEADFISGTTSHEFYRYIKAAYPDSLERATADDFLLSSIEDTRRFIADDVIKHWNPEVHTTLAHEYRDWEEYENADIDYQSATKYYGDLMFAVDSSRSIEAKLRSGTGALYQYVLKRPLVPSAESPPSWVGGRHGDDVIYMFGIPYTDKENYSDEDREFSLTFMSYWINFAWSGDPNNALSSSRWNKYTSERKAFLDLRPGLDLPGNPTDFNLEKNKFWSDVIPLLAIDSTSPTTTTTISSTTEMKCAEIPQIGEGLGLALTPEEADTAIYAMFSVSLVLGFILIVFLVLWALQGHVIKTRNAKIKKQNTMNINGAFEKESNGELSAL